MAENISILDKKNDVLYRFESRNLSGVINYTTKLTRNNDCFNEIYLPVAMFNNDSLSALETITKYIKEEISLSYREIAFLLNRNERTIWGAYYSSRRKMQGRFFMNYSRFYIPIFIFKDRSLSVLETITRYLKEELGLRYCQIASLLSRDDRTIWTVYNRAKKKRRIKKQEGILLKQNLSFI